MAGWFALADALIAAGRVPDEPGGGAAGEGRGFCAGVDIKEIQAKGDEALVGVNRGCAAAFAAVYDCEVPSSPPSTASAWAAASGSPATPTSSSPSDDATFGLPEVDRGALGAATHLARLVPQHKMREMVYTAKPGHGGRAGGLRLGRRGRAAGPPPGGGASSWPPRSPPRARPSSAGPRSRSTASTRST